ncbi:Kiwa anti-phage protein KwaB-like domain-containing protein [Halomicrococcus sp. NG-SE-24]|uniref:Kiwa anti-phage protein KwaB-like domain-containing protein n=1 Tax=Halomicrococcus sp. NG-SE-24 TaxID=3436928 RepID=UPI003D95C3D2
MTVLQQPEDSLSEAYAFLDELPDSGSQEFLLARESQTTESLLGGEENTIYTFEKFVEDDEEVLELLRGRSLDVLENQVKSVVKNENKELAEYDISNRKKEDALLEFVVADKIQNFDRFEGLLETGATGESKFNPGHPPAFQAYRVVQGDKVRFAALQKFTQRQVLSDDDGVKLAFEEDSGDYDPFTGTVVSFLSRIDCFYFEGTVYILNATKFEDIFDYLYEYKDDANDVLTSVKNSDINIADFDRFVDSVKNDRRALRKMREIKQVGIYNDMTREEVEQIVEDFGISIDVEEGEGNEDWSIAIPDMRKKWDIIRLLNDDHLYSDLSKDRYQVYGKDNRS